MIKRFLPLLLAIAALGLAIHLVSAILLPFIAGIVIAYLLDRPVGRLERLRVPRDIGSLLALVGFLLAVVFVVLLLVPVLQSQIVDLAKRLPDYAARAQAGINQLIELAQEYLTPDDVKKLQDAGSARIGDLVRALVSVLQGAVTSGVAVINLLSLVFITPVVAFFLLRDWQKLLASIDSWLPRQHLETIRQQARLIDETLSGFLRGQASVCGILAIYYALGLSIVGLKSGAVIGLLIGLLAFIPFVGSIGGAALSLTLAAIQFSTWGSIGAVAAVIAFGQIVEGNYLTPKLVGERVNLHPVWVMFALLGFGAVFGFVGLVIAVPAAAVIGVLVRFALGRYLASELYRTGPGA